MTAVTVDIGEEDTTMLFPLVQDTVSDAVAMNHEEEN
ncbi:hypothetical protein SRB5_06880 [Streptomyces sp. RB5]|uniref:Uncharacterized protein n=1 Tax=Streptomyces smaragdinus TaxID=2585196 RepID=A0A7K0CAV0_9ACTN|nr:hypothetical protein [Streptomyces smaragdinus]